MEIGTMGGGRAAGVGSAAGAQRLAVVRLARGELWCLVCGEALPGWMEECPRCEGRRFVRAVTVLRKEEYIEVAAV